MCENPILIGAPTCLHDEGTSFIAITATTALSSFLSFVLIRVGPAAGQASKRIEML
jgi:hypothetical protein